MYTGHSSFFLYELPVHLLCSFFFWTFQSQFSNSYRIVRILYIFPDINPFHVIWVENILSMPIDYCSFFWICGLVSFIIPGKLSVFYFFKYCLITLLSSPSPIKLIIVHLYRLLCLHSFIIFCILLSLYATFWVTYHSLFSSLVILSFALFSC